MIVSQEMCGVQVMSMFADEMRRNQVIDGFIENMQNMQDHINSLVQNFRNPMN